MVGCFAFENREDYAQAAKARKVLIAAIEMADTCETCAIAMAVDRRCYRCKISHEDGHSMKETRRSGGQASSGEPAAYREP